MKQLFQLYYSRLCYFAFKMIEDREAAQDLVQDAFVGFWHRRDDFDSEPAVKTFLYVTVRNACLNRIRHEKVKKKFIDANKTSEAEEEKGLNNLVQAEVVGEIHRAIEELPQGCRQVLKLAYFEGLKNDEIAGELGVSVNTVKTQKARALQLLRLKLDADAFLALLLVLLARW
ncbi:RNA polymerase sigma-70 factor [Paraflavisolibacter sp. H34]|uniref:RNA polymerase sigma-70 factor n=1 Tax=Huijunlia imazamoxiresistens TaxID=3127457 RepID=UPI003015D5C4